MRLVGKMQAALAATALLAAGCFSLETGTVSSSGEKHVLVANYGWYLFHFIPVVCGNANPRPWLPWVFFRDDVTMEKIQSRFMSHAESEGGDAYDLSYTTSESVMLNIPAMNLPLPLPYLLTYKDMQLSGTLRKAAPPVAEGGAE